MPERTLADGSVLAPLDEFFSEVEAGRRLVDEGDFAYEFFVIDPFWPSRPELIQPTRGGVSRKRFWIPIHISFEAALEKVREEELRRMFAD